MDQHIALLGFAEMVVSVGDDPYDQHSSAVDEASAAARFKIADLTAENNGRERGAYPFAATIIQSPRIEP
ncbi:hypothetical protein [Bradyrhizobium rifense]|uniref:hypothetical protein n=1 Tax=Bradyrhizobium rifense TaxID=515499 RepID=UPI001FE689DA|nr:hypothetical protein [Bradyrhizobium rifense]